MVVKLVKEAVLREASTALQAPEVRNLLNRCVPAELDLVELKAKSECAKLEELWKLE